MPQWQNFAPYVDIHMIQAGETLSNRYIAFVQIIAFNCFVKQKQKPKKSIVVYISKTLHLYVCLLYQNPFSLN